MAVIAGTAQGETIQPFRIAIPKADLDDLCDRLARTRWPDELAGAGWDYGVSLSFVQEMVERWRTRYDWRKHEAVLNQLPQFTTTIDGQNVHFVHVRSPEPNALPVILTHGWPGSFMDFLKVIAPLSDPGQHGGDPADAFHVIVPSIPGYGFSGPPSEPGWDSTRIAKAWNTLVHRLGYDRYGAHGGDVGALITRELGILKPAGLVGVHVLEIFAFPTGAAGELDGISDFEREGLKTLESFNRNAAYFKMQQTRPQTPAFGLTDSPAGQLAWNSEAFVGFGGEGAGLIDRDDFLTQVMIYWLTATAGSAARHYYEDAKSGAGYREVRNETPTGVAVFPNDFRSIRKLAERANNVVHWSTFDRGGHWAAFSAPDLLIGDLREFFRSYR
ncbi:MAG TPA: epoxide hydrolase [Thermoanaerobaculia bacterium]|nr:epoxide hydrolase [Thermoanaerobaculia bacterium]